MRGTIPAVRIVDLPTPKKTCHCLLPAIRRSHAMGYGYGGAGYTWCQQCKGFIKWGVGPHDLGGPKK